MTFAQHLYDIVTRSLKTGLAAYAAFIAAGGLDIVHLSSQTQFDLAYLATVATAVLNISLKIHSSITQSLNKPQNAPTQLPQ